MERKSHKLKYLSPLGALALSLGTAIGWGSFVVTNNQYLRQAGPVGSIIGLVLGSLIMVIIAKNYHILSNKYPDNGGIYTYTKKAFSHDHGFLSAWFMILGLFAVLWANITSIPLFAKYFFGSSFQFGFHYQIFNYDVYLGEILLSIACLVLVGGICLISRKISAYVQIGFVLIFVAVALFLFVFSVAKHEGGVETYKPAFASKSTPVLQIIAIVSMSPWAFIGFESITHSSSEYKFSIKKTFIVLLVSIILTGLIYIAITQISVMAYPEEYSSWEEYINDLPNLEGIKALPLFYVSQKFLGAFGLGILSIALVGVIVTSLIGNITALSRLLSFMAKDRVFNKKMGYLNKKRIPVYAILFILIVSSVIPFLGRTAIGWIVDITTICAALSYGYVSISAFKVAQNKKDRIFGILGSTMAAIFLVLLFLPFIFKANALSAESYFLLSVWAIIGLLYFRITLSKDGEKRFGKSAIVLIGLLFLIFITSLLWIAQKVTTSNDELVSKINDYYKVTPKELVDLNYIDSLRAVTNRSIAISIFLLVLMLGFTSIIIFDVYRIKSKRENESLKEASTARDIAMRDSLTGVKSKHAYAVYEADLNLKISSLENLEFAVVVSDINDLKKVNDEFGHDEGDKYIKSACQIICDIFKHSPVFRIGGDEFVAILMKDDYKNREYLMNEINSLSDKNNRENGIVVSSGMALYEKGDQNLSDVFKRADEKMYERKEYLKRLKNEQK